MLETIHLQDFHGPWALFNYTAIADMLKALDRARIVTQTLEANGRISFYSREPLTNL